ncbi:MAG: carbohydrate binding family 9 domain-containing protein, partial [Rhodothermales bacterium]
MAVKKALLSLGILTLFLIPDIALAQPAAPADVTNQGFAPLAQAKRVDEAPMLDGDVLNDPVWQDTPTIENFWQTIPVEGNPATERTVARVVFTDEVFYLSVVCYTASPGNIVVSDALRDGALNGVDSFQFILDTYKDTQSGFVFGTSPAGIEYDAQVTNEGAGVFGFAGQQSGSGGGLNVNWDGSWSVATKTGDYGWSAEFAIPFRTLRFPNKSIQSWGINLQRTIPHSNEVVYWAKLPRQFNLYKVSMAGTLEGLEVPSPKNLKIMPYALGQTSVDGNIADGNLGGETGEFGVDVKYSITPSVALDLTYNTDFAQVEVDEEQ